MNTQKNPNLCRKKWDLEGKIFFPLFWLIKAVIRSIENLIFGAKIRKIASMIIWKKISGSMEYCIVLYR